MNDNEELRFRTYLEVLRRQRWVVILVVLAALATSLITSLLLHPVYRAESTVLVRSGRGVEDYIMQGSTNIGTYTPQNFVQVIQSRTIIQEVAPRLGISENPNSREFQDFQDAISAYFIPGTDLMRVQVEWTSSRVASDAVNALVEALISHNRQLNQAAISNAQSFLENRVASAEKELKEAEAAYINALKSSSEPLEDVSSVGSIPQLEILLAENLVEMDSARASLRQAAERFRKAGGNPDAAAATLNAPQGKQIRARLADLENQYVAAAEEYGEEAPLKAAPLVQKIESTKADLAALVVRLSPRPKKSSPDLEKSLQTLAQWHSTVAGLQVRDQALNSLISQREKVLGHLSSRQAEVAALARNARVAEQMYVTLKQKLEETQLAQAASFAEVQVLDPAVPPRYPVRPNLALNLVLALIVGLLTGFGLAGLIDQWPAPGKTPPVGNAPVRRQKVDAVTEEAASAEDNIRPALLIARRPEKPLVSTILMVLIAGTAVGFAAAMLFHYYHLGFNEHLYLKIKQGIKILLGVR